MSGLDENGPVRLVRLEGPSLAGFRHKKAGIREPAFFICWRCGDISHQTVLTIRLLRFRRTTLKPPLPKGHR
jgi:hypothetical protein